MSSQKTVAPSDRVVIGIAFGNSNSSIAYTTGEDKADVIANEDGDRQIPTVLTYIDGEEFVGTQAKAQLVRNSKNTIAYFKDFLGKDFKSIDPTHCHAAAHPLEHESTVAFSVHDTPESENASTLTVSEVTTRYLRRLISSASDYLGKKVTSAVITVPTNFSEKQQEALTKAANDADLEVLQYVREPVAAALAYDARAEASVSDKNIVVADLGGTRSDVAVIASRGGMYTILATAHDFEFTGSELDKILIDHFAKEFIKKHSVDPREDARGLAKLKLESEATKKSLSIGTNAAFSVESLVQGIDYASTINRLRYETIGRRVFEGYTRLIESVVKKADLDVLDIDEIILSGGISHTPRVARNLSAVFPESTTIYAPSTVPTAINPSEINARGAALQASLIQDYESEDVEQSTHPAVTTVPHLSNAIGVLSITGDETKGVFNPVIAAETALPVRRTLQIATPKDGGDVLVKVVEGGSHIKVTQPEPKKKDTSAKVEDAGSDDSEDDSSDEEEEEEQREKIWKVGHALAEAAVRGVKKGGKVEVTINVAADLSVTITAREVGAKGGVRGTISAP